ncbi:hypothetical protein V501_09392 [Pseudogymnoascus sp. VKM F-4519 (FW-2642)]|nr:hypothetical protein V501_09392 [Pseudogymnoascus sp. VKM F-4519 (FW-2642)]
MRDGERKGKTTYTITTASIPTLVNTCALEPPRQQTKHLPPPTSAPLPDAAFVLDCAYRLRQERRQRYTNALALYNKQPNLSKPPSTPLPGPTYSLSLGAVAAPTAAAPVQTAGEIERQLLGRVPWNLCYSAAHRGQSRNPPEGGRLGPSRHIPRLDMFTAMRNDTPRRRTDREEAPWDAPARDGGYSGQGAFVMEVRHREGVGECGHDGPTVRAVHTVWARRTGDEPEDPTGESAAPEPDRRDARYDTLSTFGMYNRPESADMVSDHLITLGISLPRWSYGPLDPVSVYIKLSPNLDHMKKATKVMIQKITMAIEEEITFNHEGDEPTKKVNRIAKQTTPIGVRMPGTGYTTNLGLVFPSKENRDAEGIIRRGKPHFPMYGVNSFTTTGSLYKIEFFLIIKAHMTNTRDIVLRQPIIVCPFDQQACKEEMESIEQAAKDASHVDANNPMLPARTVIKATDRDALKALGFTLGGRDPGSDDADVNGAPLTPDVLRYAG